MEAVKEVDKDPISPILKNMVIGGVMCYPRERYASVNAVIQTVRHKAKHKKFSMKRKGDIVCVTRTR